MSRSLIRRGSESASVHYWWQRHRRQGIHCSWRSCYVCTRRGTEACIDRGACNRSHFPFSSLITSYTPNLLATCLISSPGAITLTVPSIFSYLLHPPHLQLAFSCHQVQSLSSSLLFSYNCFSFLTTVSLLLYPLLFRVSHQIIASFYL